MGEDTRYCGNCKREVSAKNFTVHSVHCQRNIAICTLCSEPVPRSHYQQHVETSHKSIQCSKCEAHLEPLQLFAHEKEECPRRLMKCQHCELEVIAQEFQRHVDYCESRTELCKGCTKYVQFKHLQFHYEYDHKYLTPEEKDQENSSDEEGSECPICLGPVTLPLVLECGHTFCMVCVKGIANTTKNCAICRRDIPRDMLMDIRFCREEDIIKNYVNKPREKKTQRSHSVPSRTSSSFSSSSRRVARTTQDYDDMVSALLSSRTSSTSYRYQRPANTHTPPSYTPYSGSESCKDSCKDTDSKDDDCCCSSSKSTSSSSSTSATATSTSTTASTARTTSTSTTSSVSKPPPASSVSTSSSISSETSRSTSVSSSSTSKTSSSVSTRSVASSSSTSATTTSSSESSSSTTASSSSYSSYSNGARPRRPTSLALETTAVMSSVSASVSSSSSSSRSSGSRDVEPPANATQEQYDRWLAFQLAKAEDDLPPSEFNKKHRPTFRRSLSMPERAQDSSSDSSDSEDSDSPRSRRSSRRPPASPRTVTNSSSSSSSSSSSRSTPISKSSSDSNASSSTSNSGSALSTGARPKNAGLKKRVSFKEDGPAIRREAPVMLPCEFCDEMFAERDLMRHQTSCEQNETQLPRASRIAQRAAAAAAAAAMSSSTSTTSSSGITTTTSSNTTVETSSSLIQSRIQSTASSSPRRSPAPTPPTPGRTPTPVCAPPRKATAPSKSPAPVPPRSQSSGSSRRSPTPASPGPSRSYSSGWRSSRDTSRGSPVSTPTSPPPSCPPSISPPPVSPPPTTTITIVDQKPSVVVSPSQSAGSNRPFSVSPAPSSSTSNSSVSSGSMSSSSVSTTPSTSSSASPVPAISATPELAPPDTPTTDLEYDYEDEDGPFMRPRRGRLLSSAIFSWRSISGSRRGYTRSNTAPLEDTGADEDTTQVQPVITSRSATQLPAHRPSPDIETAGSSQPSSSSPQPTTASQKTTSPPPSAPDTQTKPPSASPQPAQEHADTVFIKNPHKYRAPPPPQTPPNLPNVPNLQQKASPSPTANINGYIKSPTPWEKAFMSNKATSPPPATSPTPAQEKTLANGYVNGVIKFDSKTMMNGHMSKEIEELIPCEFCKQVFSPDKFRSHQTMCEAALQPPPLRSTAPLEQPATPKGRTSAPARHNKGPAPSPPESFSKDDDAAGDVYEAQRIRRMERSQSVKDDRSSFSDGIRVSRRLERASSIKESRTFYGDNASLSRRWGSREVVHSNSMESSASLASGGWGGSTSNLFSSYAGGHSWTQHINSVRSDVRSLNAAANCASSSGPYYDNGGDSDNGGELDSEMCGVDRGRTRYNNTLLMEVRAALNKNTFSHVANESGTRYRERSSSRPRPASMYTSSGTWGSMFDLSSPTRSFNISDAFSSASLASKRRYIR